MSYKSNFKDKFTNRFTEALKIFGLDKILKETYIEKNNPIKNAVYIITNNIGREWGLSTRMHTLEKAGLTENSPLEEKMELLKIKFKEHMASHNIPILYGDIKSSSTLILQVGGCIFKNNDLIPREGYSIGFVEAYFGAKVKVAYTLCDKKKEDCCGENCEIWVEY